jgi:hypothetical protein
LALRHCNKEIDMRRVLIAALALIAGVVSAFAQQFYPPLPPDAIALGAASGNVANASAVATLTATTGKRTWICGFAVNALGATGQSVVALAITGLGGTFNYSYLVPPSITTSAPVAVTFNPCLPALAASSNIVVTLPALGAGNTNASVSAWGYNF